MRRLWGLVGALAFVAGTWALAAAAVARPFLPGPGETLGQLGTLVASGALVPHLTASLTRLAWGVALSLVPALGLGLAAGLSPRTDAVVRPLLYLLHPIPKVVFLPLFFLFLGLGDEPKVGLIAFIVFSQLAVTTRDAVYRLPGELLDQMRILGARRRDLLVDVVVPGILPEVLSALKIALGTSIAVLYFAESFASVSGLGWFITDAWSRVDYLSMNAAIVALALVGLALLALVDGLAAWACRWQGRLR
ncbi:MAG TPA: ABC transporter permease subunit [Spirochaetia bacterium]|nr:ABC transporter permease subunit [Spirochaetia bacterium]